RAAGPWRAAAALAYVFPRGGGLHVPFTVRRNDLPEHPGQVSLPGGRPGPGEALEDTAWREAREEIGLGPAEHRVVGRLAPVSIPITHRRLHVFVAIGPDPGPLRREAREVERIVLVRIDDLLRPTCRRRRRVVVEGRPLEVPYFDVAGLFLWGATAMAMAELVGRLEAAGGSEGP
ncbi:MAG: CoA pyrophosphatase, partial [Planctomycetota bacterium]